MKKNGKNYAVFLLFSAGVLSTAGFAQRAALVYPEKVEEAVILERLEEIQVQDFGNEACKLVLESPGLVIEKEETTRVEAAFAKAQANAKAREERKAWEAAARKAQEASAPGNGGSAGAGGAVSASNSTLKLLASIIFCEAGNQPYEGQVAVGAVVMNRVKSGSFPDTIQEVIYQKGQFTPAGSGWLDRVLQSEGYTASAMSAAKDALAGVNPVGNCLYFDQGSQGMKIGDHYFH